MRTSCPGTTAAAVTAAFERAYADAPFVRLTGDALPEIKHVAHTNFCDIGWKVDEATGRVFVVSVIDNLVKGAAGPGDPELQRDVRLRSEGGPAVKRVVVLKLGGELLEDDQRLKAIGKAIKSAAREDAPLVVVHGGGREIDAALAQVGIPKRQVDGLRVTDADTLNIVVSVLAGSINTQVRRGDQRGRRQGGGPDRRGCRRGAGREGGAAQGDERRDGRPRAWSARRSRRPSPDADRDAVQGRLRAGDRLRRRVEERKVVQRQRRYVGGEPGGAAEGQAPGDRRRHAGRARQERTRRFRGSTRSGSRSW